MAGALIDILLHVLQLHDMPALRWLQRRSAWMTLFGCILTTLSLFVQFNAGALVMDVFISIIAVTSIIKNQPLQEH